MLGQETEYLKHSVNYRLWRFNFTLIKIKRKRCNQNTEYVVFTINIIINLEKIETVFCGKEKRKGLLFISASLPEVACWGNRGVICQSLFSMHLFPFESLKLRGSRIGFGYSRVLQNRPQYNLTSFIFIRTYRKINET